MTYIEDFAGALVTLGERDEVLGRVWHVLNDQRVTARRFVEMVFNGAGHLPDCARPRAGASAVAALSNRAS